jgi:hypothetical protein
MLAPCVVIREFINMICMEPDRAWNGRANANPNLHDEALSPHVRRYLGLDPACDSPVLPAWFVLELARAVECDRPMGVPIVE